MSKNELKVRTLEDLTDSREIEALTEGIERLKQPTKILAKYLNKVEELYDADTNTISEYMSVFTAWQNFLEVQLAVADTVRTIAEDQVRQMRSFAMNSVEGTVNLKKDLVDAEPTYVKAVEVLNTARAGYRGIKTTFDSCERAFRLASRILTARLGTKFID